MPAQVQNAEADKPQATTTDAASTAAPTTQDGSTTTTDSTTTAAAASGKDADTDKGGDKTKGEDAAPKTALEAAQRVMAKEGKKTSTEEPQGKTDTDAAGKPEEKDKPKEADAEDANLPFKDHPRWKTVSSENRILKVAKEKNEAAIKELEPKAKTFDDLTTYLRDNNLQRDDFQQGLSIMAAIRNDPAKAYELMLPIMERLESLVGARLPDDLKAKVEAGQIDAESAREMAKARGRVEIEKTARETLEQRQAREAEERTRGEQQRVMNDVTQALNAWDAEWAGRDPDAAKLRPFVLDLLLIEGQKKPPTNNVEARELAERCVVEARKRLAGFIPAPQPKEGVLPTGGASTATTTPVPKSSLEAAQAALRMATG